MTDICTVCHLSFRGVGEPYNAQVHCPRSNPRGRAERDCLRLGLVQRDATIRGQAALIARAREFARDVEARVTMAIEELGE